MLKNLLLVAAGGAVGSSLRYLISLWASRNMSGTYPWGTFLVNIIGCALIGFLIAMVSKSLLPDPLKLLLITGFCGGFTTFSALGAENLSMIQQNQWTAAIGYSVTSILVGTGAAWTGFFIAKNLIK